MKYAKRFAVVGAVLSLGLLFDSSPNSPLHGAELPLRLIGAGLLALVLGLLAGLVGFGFDAIAARRQRSRPSKPSPHLSPPQHQIRYFAFIYQDVKGPYTTEQLSALRDATTITDETQCCLEGTESWRPLHSINL